MIFEVVLNILALLLDVVLWPLKIAALPDVVKETFFMALTYLADGIAIVAAYTDFAFLVALFTFAMVVDGVYMSYNVVMWILRKIPFLGID